MPKRRKTNQFHTSSGIFVAEICNVWYNVCVIDRVLETLKTAHNTPLIGVSGQRQHQG